jgi:hypothetical protein
VGISKNVECTWHIINAACVNYCCCSTAVGIDSKGPPPVNISPGMMVDSHFLLLHPHVVSSMSHEPVCSNFLLMAFLRHWCLVKPYVSDPFPHIHTQRRKSGLCFLISGEKYMFPGRWDWPVTVIKCWVAQDSIFFFLITEGFC